MFVVVPPERVSILPQGPRLGVANSGDEIFPFLEGSESWFSCAVLGGWPAVTSVEWQLDTGTGGIRTATPDRTYDPVPANATSIRLLVDSGGRQAGIGLNQGQREGQGVGQGQGQAYRSNGAEGSDGANDGESKALVFKAVFRFTRDMTGFRMSCVVTTRSLSEPLRNYFFHSGFRLYHTIVISVQCILFH